MDVLTWTGYIHAIGNKCELTVHVTQKATMYILSPESACSTLVCLDTQVCYIQYIQFIPAGQIHWLAYSWAFAKHHISYMLAGTQRMSQAIEAMYSKAWFARGEHSSWGPFFQGPHLNAGWKTPQPFQAALSANCQHMSSGVMTQNLSKNLLDKVECA